MTSKQFMHKATRGKLSREKARQMSRARWAADRAKRDEEEPARVRALAEVEAINLPRKAGDVLGVLQWTDAATGKVRRWRVQRGSRADQVTLAMAGGKPTGSHGWTGVLNQLRGHLCGRKF